jgi:hypothetical protein
VAETEQLKEVAEVAVAIILNITVLLADQEL